MHYREIKVGDIIETIYGFAKVIGHDKYESFFVCIAPRCLRKLASIKNDNSIQKWNALSFCQFMNLANDRYVVVGADSCYFAQFDFLHIHLNRVIKIVDNCPINFE